MEASHRGLTQLLECARKVLEMSLLNDRGGMKPSATSVSPQRTEVEAGVGHSSRSPTGGLASAKFLHPQFHPTTRPRPVRRSVASIVGEYERLPSSSFRVARLEAEPGAASRQAMNAIFLRERRHYRRVISQLRNGLPRHARSMSRRLGRSDQSPQVRMQESRMPTSMAHLSDQKRQRS